MRRLIWTLASLSLCPAIVLGTSAAAERQVPPAGAAPASQPQGHGGIRWEPSLAAAKAKAARTGKPLLLLHMFGRLDEPFC
jgi:hypothetical protein